MAFLYVILIFFFIFFIKYLDKKPYKVYNSSNVSSESLLYTLYKNEVCHYGVLKNLTIMCCTI